MVRLYTRGNDRVHSDCLKREHVPSNFSKPRRSSRHRSFVWKLRPVYQGDVFRDPRSPEIRIDRG